MDQPQVVSSQANIITSTMIIIFIMRITVIIPISMILTIILQLVELTSESLLDSNYNSTNPTVIMSHGEDDDLDRIQ